MTDQDFRDTVLKSLATISNNIKWILKIGSVIIFLAITTAGSLWLRTESNALNIAVAEAAVEVLQQSQSIETEH